MSNLIAFFYGIISAFGATVFQQIILLVFKVELINTQQITPLLIFGAFSEEVFKFVMIYKVSKNNLSSKKLVLASIFIGLGFSLIEVLLKTWDNLKDIQFVYQDYLGIFIIHIITAALIGCFFTIKKPYFFQIFGLILALLLHLTYNAFRIYIF